MLDLIDKYFNRERQKATTRETKKKEKKLKRWGRGLTSPSNNNTIMKQLRQNA